MRIDWESIVGLSEGGCAGKNEEVKMCWWKVEREENQSFIPLLRAASAVRGHNGKRSKNSSPDEAVRIRLRHFRHIPGQWNEKAVLVSRRK